MSTVLLLCDLVAPSVGMLADGDAARMLHAAATYLESMDVHRIHSVVYMYHDYTQSKVS